MNNEKMRLDEEIKKESYGGLKRLTNTSDKNEEKRKEALADQDGLNYYLLCEKCRVEPEDGLLYEKGWMEYKAQKL